jgi:cytochrome c5
LELGNDDMRLPPTLILSAVALLGTSAQATEQRMQEGKKAYENTCARCHEAGVMQAPRTQQAKDWEGRSHLWDSVLVEHANKGYLAMPPQGGDGGMSDYDIRAAAEYMVTITHPDLPRD